MTSISTAEEWRAAIDMDGVICLTDPAVGLRADEFAKKGWPRINIDGLRFLKKHTLDDCVSRSSSISESESSYIELSASSRSIILHFPGRKLKHICCSIPSTAAYSASLHQADRNARPLRSLYEIRGQR